jgi:hypothetical protein
VGVGPFPAPLVESINIRTPAEFRSHVADSNFEDMSAWPLTEHPASSPGRPRLLRGRRTSGDHVRVRRRALG